MPEIQALTERLSSSFVGATLLRAEQISFHSLRTVSDPASLTGSTLRSVTRRGKYVIAAFDDARVVLSFSQGGRLEIERPARASRARGALARFNLGEPGAWLLREFGTERRAGWWILRDRDREGDREGGPLDGLGPECDDPAFAAWVRTTDDPRQLHTALRDQRTVAGLGRGWTDDILHRARLSPFASLRGLNADQRDRLLAAITSVVEGALTTERARTGGLPAKLGDRFTIHGRAGTPCPECGADLRRVSYASREVAYCPVCQTGGKVLADRRMSRLIR